MDIESDQKYQEYYNDWISRILQYIATAQYFFTGFTQAVKLLLKKGLILAWKEIRATISKLSKTDFFFAGINITVGLFGLINLLAGISLLGYQAILWLQTGFWTEYSLLIMFNYLFENTFLHQWIIGPESWIGMQQLSVWLLESTPIWLALIVPGLSIAISAAVIFFIALTIRFYQLKSL